MYLLVCIYRRPNTKFVSINKLTAFFEKALLLNNLIVGNVDISLLLFLCSFLNDASSLDFWFSKIFCIQQAIAHS